MKNKTESSLRFLIADSDPSRRGRIMAHFAAGTSIEAASLSEAFDLAESQRPDAIALCADITGDAGFDMFLHMIDALSISFVIYGDHARDRIPARLRKSIPFIHFADGGDPELIFDGFLREPGHRASDRPTCDRPASPVASAAHLPSLVVLGASTGGVSALETVLTAFPANCPPTLIVQHIRAGFVYGMIKRLDARCLPRVVPADDAIRLQPGHVYIAHDPQRHLIVQTGEPARCRLKAQSPRHGHRPSVDVLFESVAGRRGVAAALLTGMGADGAEGLARIKAGGGLTIAQNEDTCVVYGMPRVAVERGAADHVLPLDRIAAALFAGSIHKGRGSAFSREMAK